MEKTKEYLKGFHDVKALRCSSSSWLSFSLQLFPSHEVDLLLWVYVGNANALREFVYYSCMILHSTFFTNSIKVFTRSPQ